MYSNQLVINKDEYGLLEAVVFFTDKQKR